VILFEAPCPCCGLLCVWRASPSEASYVGGYSGHVTYRIDCPTLPAPFAR
jgi:hypothetical protein